VPTLTLYLTPPKLRRVNREFIAFVRASYPRRFYKQEPWWAMYDAAALLRMSDTVEGMMLLMARRKDGEALVLLRSLYEQAVVFMWAAIDPEERHRRWGEESNVMLLRAHNELLPYGHTLLTPAEVKACEAAKGTPPVDAMARAVDDYWTSRVPGFAPTDGLLSMHGLYQSIYRLGSRPAHGAFDSLEPYLRKEPYPPCVAERANDPMLWYSLAAPLFGLSLVVGAERFDWIDAARVLRFLDRATAETVRRREQG
jgi:hypothetical protein